MSSIALPLIHSVTATNTVGGVSPTVPIEQVIDISVLDITNVPGGSPRYEIIFTVLSTDNQPRKIIWRYADATARDTEYGTIISTYSLVAGNSIAMNATVTTAIVFEGATADDFEVTLDPGDPTSDVTITLPDLSGTAIVDAGAQTITGVKTFDNGLKTDTISEETAAAGVTADGVLLKDSTIALSDGLVSNLSVKIGADADNGFYGVSDTQLGVAVEGALVAMFDTNGVATGTVSEQVADAGVTVDGALIKDGSFIGKQATATATADGLTTGALTGTDQFVSVTAAAATDIVALPLDANCPVGTVIRGWVGANGFELRSNAADLTLTVNAVTMGTTNEAAIPATTLFRVEKVAALTWILTATDELGAVIAAIVPDAV